MHLGNTTVEDQAATTVQRRPGSAQCDLDRELGGQPAQSAWADTAKTRTSSDLSPTTSVRWISLHIPRPPLAPSFVVEIEQAAVRIWGLAEGQRFAVRTTSLRKAASLPAHRGGVGIFQVRSGPWACPRSSLSYLASFHYPCYR